MTCTIHLSDDPPPRDWFASTTLLTAKRGTTAEQMEAEEMRLMEQLIQKLSQRDLAAIFNQPVMASEYPDYHSIVSTPMDLGTIQENIRQGVYPSLEACAKDVRTVWTNAYLYNPATSVVAQGARALSKVFEGMYNKINPTDFNYAREPNVDERNKFSRDIYRVEDSQLAEAVGILEQRCPDAVVRDNEDGYFVLKVDALPSPVFWEVELFLRKCLYNQPDRTKKKIPTTFRPPPESLARLSGRKRGSDGSGGDGSSGETGGGGGDGGGKETKTGEAAAGVGISTGASDDAAAANGHIGRNGDTDTATSNTGDDRKGAAAPAVAAAGAAATAAAATPAAGVEGSLTAGTGQGQPEKHKSGSTAETAKPRSASSSGCAVSPGSGSVGTREGGLPPDTSFREASGEEPISVT